MVIKLSAVILVLIVIIIAAPIGNSGLATAQPGQKQKTVSYVCPMHPNVTSAKPGKCPKCGMALRVKADEAEADAAPASDLGNTLSFSSSRIPDIGVYDQAGNRLNFYRDLIKGKTVAINFIFTTCTTICPPLTATFRRVQQELAEHAPDVRLISISVDPATDTPDRLREFAAKFKAGLGWTFVTGGKTEIDSLLQSLGVAVSDKNDHTPMILVGNDVADRWTRSFGLSSPATLVKVITETANYK